MDISTAQAQELRLSATLEINELVQSQLANGKDVVHLRFGNATFPIHESVLEAHSNHQKYQLHVDGWADEAQRGVF